MLDRFGTIYSNFLRFFSCWLLARLTSCTSATRGTSHTSPPIHSPLYKDKRHQYLVPVPLTTNL